MGKNRGHGEGSIYQMKDGRWRAAVSLGWQKNEAGEPVWKRRVITAGTRAAVQEELKRVLRDQQQGLPIAPDKQTVGQYLEHWLETTVRPSVRPKTYRSYEQMVRNHLVKSLPAAEWKDHKLDDVNGLGEIRLSKLTVQTFQQYMAAKLQAGNSPSLVSYLRTVFRTALNDAVRMQLIARNIAALCKPPRVVKQESPGFTIDEAKRFLAAAVGHRHEALFTVALAVGLRHGEALALRLTDFNAEAGTLQVFFTLQRIDGKLVTVETKSEKGKRIVPLPLFCMAALNRWLETREQYRMLAGSSWQEHGFLFSSRRGTPLLERNVLREFYKLLDAAKLDRRRVHDLRHACVTLLAAQGADVRTIADIVGHSDIRLTQNIYQHAFIEMKREAVGKLDSVLGNGFATEIATNSNRRKAN